MPSTLPLSRPPPTTTSSTSTSATTPTTRTSHTYQPSPFLYIHLTYHAPHIPHPVDEITLRQALTAALRQHHGQHGAAIPIDILSTWLASPTAASRTTANDDGVTHMIVRAPLADGSAVVGACGAWIGEPVGGKGASAGGDQEERRTGWIVRAWDGVLGRLALGVDGGGQALFAG
ncbi:hypothetical protein HDK77DRAFT_508262 [Phyllosticta capitalensis]|uniref:uncharacterized protein n=1 Tax=Phyllosticta capitalensis TaxID=121624 RepID=UPI00312E74C9